MDLDHLNLKTFRDGVYEALKLSILRCELLPGQRLLEKELVSKIGKSRTPVREAIIKLEQEGLVEKLNGKGGYFVSSIRKQDIEEIFNIREVLESYCVSLTINRIGQEELHQLEQIIHEEELSASSGNIYSLIESDTRFHEIIYRACGNQKLYEILNNLKNHIYRFRALSFKSSQRKNIPLSNHKKLLLAFRRKDKNLAKRLTIDTISRSKNILLQEVLEGKLESENY
jgi:DNA-binding GntR family transcriptional regulator